MNWEQPNITTGANAVLNSEMLLRLARDKSENAKVALVEAVTTLPLSENAGAIIHH